MASNNDDDDKPTAILARLQSYQGKQKKMVFAGEINVQDYFGHQFALIGRKETNMADRQRGPNKNE